MLLRQDWLKMQKLENSALIPHPIGPYSTAIVSNSMLYVSGQIGLNPDTLSIVKGGIKEECQQILKNLNQILFAQGLSSKDVVMSSIFLIKMSDFDVVNDLYGKWVNLDLPPARQTIAVKELPKGAQIEISIIAELKA